MTYTVTLSSNGQQITLSQPQKLSRALQDMGVPLDTPCGGRGSCGKCKVRIDGQEVLACQYEIDRDITVELPSHAETAILASGISVELVSDMEEGYALAIDVGTTTVVLYLLDSQGRELSVESVLNPQQRYGADVISRIHAALEGHREALTELIREALRELAARACQKAQVPQQEIVRIALVANPCMQQLVFGIPVHNLAAVPFLPAITRFRCDEAKELFPGCPKAELYLVPDISGYVGADTLGCVLACGMDRQDKLTLLVDIGTNGEMVLGNRNRMVACSTAAGPALEGANIQFGMRGSRGAIDRVHWHEGELEVHVLGEAPAQGICGSGLIDAASALLEKGILNHRGRMQTAGELPQYAAYLGEYEKDRAFYLTETICLTQSDIRQVQLAKGAIAAGIELMARHLGSSLDKIDQVLLAGAFGSFIRPESACAIGLLPPALLPKIRAVGNAAGSGAKLIACSREQQARAARLCKEIEFLELASLKEFPACFGKNTSFPKG